MAKRDPDGKLPGDEDADDRAPRSLASKRPGASLAAAKRKSSPSGIKIKPSRVGSLHAALGVPQGQKIPASKVNAAANSGSAALRKKAQFAKNARSFNS